MRRLCIVVVLLFVIAGCNGPRVVLHPIETVDIVRLAKGQQFEAPKDGYFLSDMYVKEVMEAHIE